MKCLILLAIIFKWILKITSLPKSLISIEAIFTDINFHGSLSFWWPSQHLSCKALKLISRPGINFVRHFFKQETVFVLGFDVSKL